MKNLLNLRLLILPIVFASCNGRNDKTIAPGKVPNAVITALQENYPGATGVTWELEKDGADTVYEATFLHEGKKMDAEFDRSGAPAEQD